jgi:uncharacterized cupredoxin-like copper-binding protein
MNAQLKFAAAALCGMLLGISAAQADEDFPSTSLYIELGTTEGGMTAYPRDMKLEVGKLYRLVLTNPSQSEHVVLAPEFGRTVMTAGISKYPKRVDLPGASIAAGLAVRPGEMIQVYFVPSSEGRYKLFCEDRAHTEAGMDVTVEVVL